MHLDMSNHQVAFTMQRALYDGFNEFQKQLLSDCELAPELGEPSVVFQNPPVYGTQHPNFTHFLAPGIVILIIFFLALALTGEVRAWRYVE